MFRCNVTKKIETKCSPMRNNPEMVPHFKNLAANATRF